MLAGQASFSTTGGTFSITNTPGTIINWQGFSIGASESTKFIQLSATSSVLNRVIGSDPSVILGTLSSNGRVFLINPGGILFGQGSRIDVAGLVASTLNLSNQDFLAARLNFEPGSLAGKVDNQGRVTTPTGGSVYLVGSGVSNSGIITTPQGDVILAAGQSVTILDSSTPGVRVEVTGSENAAVNLGEILAKSGQVGIYGALLRNNGTINADQVLREPSGRIVLRATRDAILDAGSRLSANGERGASISVESLTGSTRVSGTVEAKGAGENSSGGDVQILGDKVDLNDAHINVSGEARGGTVIVGGDYQGRNPAVQNASATYMSADSTISADAISTGSGGKVVLWANDSTRVHGAITARGGAHGGDGGLIETSGHWLDVTGIQINASAPAGQRGTWLLDPSNVDIIDATNEIDTLVATPAGGTTTLSPSSSATVATIGAAVIVTALDAGTNVIVDTVSTAAQEGNINVSAAITWTNPATLTLNAVRDVNVKVGAPVTATLGHLVLTAGRDVRVDEAITSTGGSLTVSGGNDVVVTAKITATNSTVVLRSGNDGTGSGSVIFAAAPVAAVTNGTVTIYYNPSSYATPTPYLPNFTLTEGATLTPYMWVYVAANGKTYDGTLSATVAFRGDPTVAGTKPVSLSGGSISFIDPNAGPTKTANFLGYSLLNATSGPYALFAANGSTTASIDLASYTTSTRT